MKSALLEGTLRGAFITPVEAISGQPQKESLAYKLQIRAYDLSSKLYKGIKMS